MLGAVIETMKNIFCLFLITTALAWGRFADAQQTKKVARIGVLSQSQRQFYVDTTRSIPARFAR